MLIGFMTYPLHGPATADKLRICLTTGPISSWKNAVWNNRLHHRNILLVGTQKGLFWYNKRCQTFGYLRNPTPLSRILLPLLPSIPTAMESYGWVGHRVCVYNPHNQKFHVFPNHSGGYPFRYPMAVAEDSASNLWFLSNNVTDLVRWKRATG